MPRKKAKDPPAPPAPPSWLVHIGKEPKGALCIAGYADNGQVRWMTEGRVIEAVAIIDCGQPLHYHVPSAGRGPHGIVFDGMTGENAKPWTPGQILAAARNRMFGFRLVDQPGATDGSQSSPAAASRGSR